jgi:hypothetical protein
MRNHPIIRNHVVLGTFTRNVRNELTREIEVHEFQVEVDASALVSSLGPKAVVSKVRKSKSIHGAIIVTDIRKVS